MELGSLTYVRITSLEPSARHLIVLEGSEDKGRAAKSGGIKSATHHSDFTTIAGLLLGTCLSRAFLSKNNSAQFILIHSVCYCTNNQTYDDETNASFYVAASSS